MKRAAFIGSGNMGGALIRAACRAIGPDQVVIADYAKEKAAELAAELGCTAAADNAGAVEGAEVIFLCVKPQGLPGPVQRGGAGVHSGRPGAHPQCLSRAGGEQDLGVHCRRCGD